MSKIFSKNSFKRRIKLYKNSFLDFFENTNKQLDRHIFRRTHNLHASRRFAIGWMSLMVVIAIGLFVQIRAASSAYLEIVPANGGVFVEGYVGNVKNMNPLYSSNSVDNALTKLMFSSLLTYNEKNELIGDLAEKWTSDEVGKVYTVTLRKDAKWHDGEAVTPEDVVYTYNSIQNAKVQSPLSSSWKGVKVERTGDWDVTFTLPNSYSPFPHLLTNGIVPEHILKDIDPSQLRGSRFNTASPVGSGPFTFRSIDVDKQGDNQTEIVQLSKNDSYYNSVPKLDGFTIKTFKDKQDMQSALNSKDITGAAFVDHQDNNKENEFLFTQTSGLYVFMNNSKPPFDSPQIREAIARATSPGLVSSTLPYATLPVRSPLLVGQVGYSKDYVQKGTDIELANKLLTESGWAWQQGEPYRKKDGKELTVQLVSEKSEDYVKFVEQLQKQWAAVGVKAEVSLEDQDTIAATTLASKKYDALLYAINIGPDPDVYVYWHSSQAKPDAKPGLNFSLYSSKQADEALEAGRSRTNPSLRAAKYKPFLAAWQKDVPAIGLHQPVFSYSTNIPVYGLQEKTINIPSDHLNNVNQWQINTKKQPQNQQ
ncbi:peptide ABC transporter substrate-binding protein [Candidatus Saccharibacteria bacterium]|nr:peptide ABC transporter substrate-binding protein [Candidatus Saccharibacteria bacterium]